ncbi:hypothetical protein MATL_G00206440 [Megalops atlanticus]|uniref:SUEL-type lectin domain-containing protein n=1 Tax=Megalops atlanticus TaxID=7932 RepID=A0A9D3PID0_MEGAT|nr:hypothetical protein MATL_G00206440 [Megalops atlanticus]
MFPKCSGAVGQSRGTPPDWGYLSKVLRNYTEQACDGEYFSVRCPPRTTISVQSSFYGRRGPAPQQCPSLYPNPNSHSLGDDGQCYVSTSFQKMLDECQDRRSCQVLVNSRLFGTDPCPGRSKYLIVWYKCRPNEYKSKVACEGDRMRLSCKRGMLIAVYSATFGRSQQGSLECPPYHRRAPAVECQSMGALQVLTSRCQGKRSCSVHASTREFGDPCYSGTRKYLSVIYTCEREGHALCQAPAQSAVNHGRHPRHREEASARFWRAAVSTDNRGGEVRGKGRERWPPAGNHTSRRRQEVTEPLTRLQTAHNRKRTARPDGKLQAPSERPWPRRRCHHIKELGRKRNGKTTVGTT